MSGAAVVAWRVSEWEHRRDPLSGAGAALYGGRFNSSGAAAAYVAGSLALAMLERLAQAERDIPSVPFAAFRLSIPAGLIEDAATALPPGWAATPPAAARAFGDEWLASGRSAVLRVPSVVLPVPASELAGEANFVLNRSTRSSPAVTVEPPRRFRFDARFTTSR